jgi:CIC family chloride channel protein
MLWPSLLTVKFVGGTLAIGSGLALGREGPTIQMGGAVGAAVAQWLRVTPRERQTLMAAGAGAGLAAAFNAPLSGVPFVLEELQQPFAPTIFSAAFIAALVADVVARSFTSQLPVFHVELTLTPPLLALPVFLVLGMLAGVLGVLYNRTLLGTMECLSRIRRWSPGVTGALVGAVVGMVGLLVPEALGGGHSLVEDVLSGHMVLWSIPGWFLLRFVLTMLSYGCGAPGGIFAPLLVLGALLGLAVGQVAQFWLPDIVTHPEAFAVIGMAAYFTAIVRAPLTGVVLIVEMTNSYAQILPLLVACFSAYAVADFLRDLPIYEAMLDRDLRRGGAVPTDVEPLMLEFTVHEGAPFDGKKVRELGLPHGCLLVTIHRGRYDTVPMADTRLESGDRLRIVVAPAAAEAVMLRRQGCAAPHPHGIA